MEPYEKSLQGRILFKNNDFSQQVHPSKFAFVVCEFCQSVNFIVEDVSDLQSLQIVYSV